MYHYLIAFLTCLYKKKITSKTKRTPFNDMKKENRSSQRDISFAYEHTCNLKIYQEHLPFLVVVKENESGHIPLPYFLMFVLYCISLSVGE